MGFGGGNKVRVWGSGEDMGVVRGKVYGGFEGLGGKVRVVKGEI